MNHYTTCYREANLSVQPATQINKIERDKKTRETLLQLYKNKERQQGDSQDELDKTNKELEPPQSGISK